MIPTIVQATASIASGDVSPADLVESCLERIEDFEDSVRAFVHVDADGARRAAKERTDELARWGPRGPLHGIPVAIKDLIDVAGMPTTAASKVLRFVPTQDAPVVALLREAGAIVVGKTNLDEFAYGVLSEPTRNPWDLDRTPGGSSGGSAAAVAAGMCLAALGTDTSGSIRVPAALCGVTGLKPRHGTVAMDGIVPLSPSLDSCGPLTISVEDAALLWEVLTGEGPGKAPKSLRLGIPSPERLGDMAAPVTDTFIDALAVLRDGGVEVVEVELPEFDAWHSPTSYLLVSEAVEVHRTAGWYPARADSYGDVVLANLGFGDGLTEEKVVEEIRPLVGLRAAFEEALATVDALLLPTTPRQASTLDDISSDLKLRREFTRDLTRFTTPVNPCTAAAVTIPWELQEELPVGLDVVAADEGTALAIAALVERLAPGVGHPPLVGIE